MKKYQKEPNKKYRWLGNTLTTKDLEQTRRIDNLEHRVITVEAELIRQNKIHTKELESINKHLEEITRYMKESYASTKVFDNMFTHQDEEINLLKIRADEMEKDMRAKLWAVVILMVSLLLSEFFHLL